MIDILPTLALCTPYALLKKQHLRLWALVLSARGISYHIEAGPRLMVPSFLAAVAVAEILAYEAENKPRPALLPVRHNSWIILLVLIIFLTLNARVQGWDLESQQALLAAGRLDVALVIQGQWWRCITALFLHVDAGHLFSNIMALALLGSFLARRYGAGLTWALFLLSGGLGNALNSLVQVADHWSIGASTGVFGLIGVLATSTRPTTGSRGFTLFLSLGFGFSLLALLGAGGERVDLGAHLFGLLAGLPWGLVLGRPAMSAYTQSPHNFAAGLLSLTLVFGAWVKAMSYAY